MSREFGPVWSSYVNRVRHADVEFVARRGRFSLMFTARRFGEEKLLAAGYAFEQATREVEKNAENLLIKF